MSCTHDKVTVAWTGDCAKIVCLGCGQVEHYHEEPEVPQQAPESPWFELALMLVLSAVAAFLWTQILLDVASQS